MSFRKCFDCKPIAEGGDRYPGCHDHCEAYQEFKHQLDEQHQLRKKAELGWYLAVEVKKEGVRKHKKRQRKK